MKFQDLACSSIDIGGIKSMTDERTEGRTSQKKYCPFTFQIWEHKEYNILLHL